MGCHLFTWIIKSLISSHTDQLNIQRQSWVGIYTASHFTSSYTYDMSLQDKTYFRKMKHLHLKCTTQSVFQVHSTPLDRVTSIFDAVATTKVNKCNNYQLHDSAHRLINQARTMTRIQTSLVSLQPLFFNKPYCLCCYPVLSRVEGYQE